VPPPNPHASITSTTPATKAGAGNTARPVGGPGVVKTAHPKTHKRTHHKMNGKHHDYTRSGTKKGPVGPHLKTVGTTG
jgi:hypothetical protein